MESGKVLLIIKTAHDEEILCADITKNGQYLVTGGNYLETVRNLQMATTTSLICAYASCITLYRNVKFVEGMEVEEDACFSITPAHSPTSHSVRTCQ